MVTGDLPTMLQAARASTAYGLGNLSQGTSTMGGLGDMQAVAMRWGGNLNATDNTAPRTDYDELVGRAKQSRVDKILQLQQANAQPRERQVTRRLVQVFIADPDENVPLGDSILYSGEQKLTDATDQELFYEIEIGSILKAHNEKRVKLINKKVKERTEHLEPARIRELKMVVVTIAQF